MRLGIVAHTLMPALRRQKKRDVCELEASLICKVEFQDKTARGYTQRNPVLLTKQKTKNKKSNNKRISYQDKQ